MTVKGPLSVIYTEDCFSSCVNVKIGHVNVKGCRCQCDSVMFVPLVPCFQVALSQASVLPFSFHILLLLLQRAPQRQGIGKAVRMKDSESEPASHIYFSC